MSVPSISPEELLARIREGHTVELLDVRSPAEFAEVHLSIARNVPLDQFNATAIAQGRAQETTPLYLICKSGVRARQACEKLIAVGFSSGICVEGGTAGCEKAGIAVVRGRRTISLERQVRITAGGLVLIGVLLSLLVHPWWIGVSAFVGAGLIVAGVTDTCGMALFLARMPWNQAQQ